MEIAEIKRTIRGPMIPVITNLKDDLSIDHDAIRENVRYCVDRGFVRGNGIFLALGAGGDFPVLTTEERIATGKTIVEAAGDTPVFIGAQHTNPTESIAIAQNAEEIGAYGIQMSAGYYFQSSDEDCLRFVEAVHNATSRVAIMMYNTHWEGYNMSHEQLSRLAELPRCVGLKYSVPSSGPGEYLRGVDKLSDRLAIVDNQGIQVMTHILGGTGYITHLATIWPEHDLEVWRLLEAGEYPASQKKIVDVNWPWQSFRLKMWNRTGSESPVIKAALELVGRTGGPSRLPVRSLNDEERAELRGILKRIEVPTVVAK